jgi:two-component system, chemotaxis family, CheB/CheR fusion protein
LPFGNSADRVTTDSSTKGLVAKPMDGARDQDLRVVCLGGSAGGLEAYKSILRVMPADTGMAFVIASHRNPEKPSLLAEILARVTTMPVMEVEEGMSLEPNHVYLMPPRTEMTVKNNEFILHAPPKQRGWPTTISIFMLSLAKACGERSIAVILSGMDHDGIAALKAIKAAGGVTFAQSDAEVSDMPRHAIDTGHVDFILPPAEIAKTLVELNASGATG